MATIQMIQEALVAFEAALADPSGPAATRAFATLARALRGHLRHEDEVVLAGLGGQVGAAAIEAARREHAPLRALLVEIEHGLRRSRGAGVVGNTRELAAALALHVRRVDALVPAAPAAPAP